MKPPRNEHGELGAAREIYGNLFVATLLPLRQRNCLLPNLVRGQRAKKDVGGLLHHWQRSCRRLSKIDK